MKGKGLLLAGIVVLGAIAAGALSLLFKAPAQSEPVKEQAQEAPVSELTMGAKLQALAVLNVGVPIAGKIESFNAAIGDEVYEGQLLAQIKSETLLGAQEAGLAELESAQTRVNNLESAIAASRLEASRATADATRVRADLDRASRNYQRQKLLLEEGATAKLVFEKAEREFRALDVEAKNLDQLAKQSEERVDSLQRELQAVQKTLHDKAEDLEAVKERLATGDISAPAGGIVTGRRGEVGENVDPTIKDFFQIATDLSLMEAVAEPGAADLARIKAGQEAYVALAESPEELLPGVVKAVEQGKVTVEFKNPNPAIKPGLTAQVRIKLT